jgi:hypothetical protein
MHAILLRHGTLWLFAVTIFVSAFLLFQVQPIMAKFILPWFGGSPGVWTTCMLVFQVLLFGGYAYAHTLRRFLTLGNQILFHGCLLILALGTLPITPTSDWKPMGNESPTRMIMLLLLCKIGAPYFLLSSTGPLLQSWLGQSNACDRPYRLYSLSNLGSLLALLSFPFVIEPTWTSTQQSTFWSVGFMGFVASCALCGCVLYRSQSKPIAQDTATGNAISPSQGKQRSDISTAGLWFSLSMLPSVLLLATTNQICMDAGVIPFLWVIPLSIYLLSFILTFDSDRWYSRRPCIMVAMVAFLNLYLLKYFDAKVPLGVELALYFAGLLCSCMVCHGELVRLRPQVDRLTTFYMTMSAGGACGGIFVALIAPVIFDGYFEWQLGLFATIMVFLATYLQSNRFWTHGVSLSTKWGLGVATLAVTLCWLVFWKPVSNHQLIAKRNFYGVLSVAEEHDEQSGQSVRNLIHGRIVHGSQFQDPKLLHTPTTYYTKSSGVGLALANHKRHVHRHIGLVGLGAGTLATYGNAGDRFRFYEINPHVIEMANEYFSFLSGSRAEIKTILGDARLTLERESPQEFDVLVLDAFSGDAIPIHLLTREAMAIYVRHLQRDGVLAIHISNLYFDLESIVAGLAEHDRFDTSVVQVESETNLGELTSTWVLLSKDRETLQNAIGLDSAIVPAGRPVLWTDDKSNLLEALK